MRCKLAIIDKRLIKQSVIQLKNEYNDRIVFADADAKLVTKERQRNNPALLK